MIQWKYFKRLLALRSLEYTDQSKLIPENFLIESEDDVCVSYRHSPHHRYYLELSEQ